MPFNDDEDIKCPETVPEEQKGLTEAERSWSAQKPQRPRVPRKVFVAAALLLLAAFAGGGWWYYRTNVLPEEYYMRATQLFKAELHARDAALQSRGLCGRGGAFR